MPETPGLVPYSLPSIPFRPTDGHKGTFGRVAVIGGSIGMSGAICLAAVAALRSGSGLVSAVVPRCIQPIVSSYEPCIMTTGLNDDPETGLYLQDGDMVRSVISGRDAIGIGPGLGQSPAAAGLVRDVLMQAESPVVIDADGLNVAAATGLFDDYRRAELPVRNPCVITPHPGEFARLTGRSVADIERHREELAQSFAASFGVVVVLKGPGTIVTDGQRIFRNNTGNAGMATGGSGDVLTGIVTSLLGQHLPILEAAALAVHAHGLAGDIAAERFTERGMIASDLLTCLPDAWKRLEDSHQR